MDTAITTTEIVFRLIPLLLLLGTAVMGFVVCLNNITAPERTSDSSSTS